MKKHTIGKILGLIVLGITVSLIFTVHAALQNNFWTDAAQSGMAEVALANLAIQKTQNEQVRQFAQQMVTDHTSINEELTTLAAGKKITLPAEVNSKQKATYDRLNGMEAANFDREFIKVMVKDHEAAVKLFERQSNSQADPDARTFAAKNLPTLQSHLQMARSLSGTRPTGVDTMNTNSANNSNSRMNTNSVNNSNSRMNTNSVNNSNSNINTM